jgi:hypothetical protein
MSNTPSHIGMSPASAGEAAFKLNLIQLRIAWLDVVS